MGTRLKTPIRIVLCGLGGWGSNWLQNIKDNKDYHLLGVVDVDKDTLEAVRIKHGIPEDRSFTLFEKAADILRPDAVAVVVSPDRHGEVIRTALQKGIHVLSEKPLAKDLEEAREFLKLHRKYPGTRFIVNQNYRGRESIAGMKHYIMSGLIGKLGFFIHSHQQTCRIPGYRLEMEHPIVDDMFIHHSDLLRFLTGEDYRELYACEDTVSWSWFKGKPLFYALIKMSGGISGTYCASWASEGKIGSWNGNIQLFGSKGCLELTDDERILFYQKHPLDDMLLGTNIPGTEMKPASLGFTEIQYTLENFKEALVNNKKCETDIEDNMKSFSAVVAARRSIRIKRPVYMADLKLG